MLSQEVYTSSPLARWSLCPGSHPHASRSQKKQKHFVTFFVNYSHCTSDSKQTCRQNWTLRSDSTVRLPSKQNNPFFVSSLRCGLWVLFWRFSALWRLFQVNLAGPGRAGHRACLVPSKPLSVNAESFPCKDSKGIPSCASAGRLPVLRLVFIASSLIVSTSPGLNWIAKDSTLSNLTLPAKDRCCCELRVKHSLLFWVFSLFLFSFFFFFFNELSSQQLNMLQINK